MPKLEIHQFPCLSDNFGVLIRDADAGVVASIDAPDAKAVAAALAAKGWRLDAYPHHPPPRRPHRRQPGAQGRDQVHASSARAAKRRRFPASTRQVGEGDTFKFGSHEVRVLDTPGHTAGHITYWFPADSVAFVGDTLFAIGCGRVIEGNAQMMWHSLQKLMALPKETAVYCGHEYTQANARFALTIEPENAALQERAKQVDQLRAAGKATLPTTIGLELETNPFLRPHVPAIQKRLGMAGKPEWQIFGEIRERKNRS